MLADNTWPDITSFRGVFMVGMSSQEIVFWVSLFGLDFGVPLMLPERLQFRIGALATGLSATGLIWSLGYHPTASQVGLRPSLVFIGVGTASLFLANLKRERELPVLIYDAAELFGRFARNHEKASTETEWRRILARYHDHRGLCQLASALTQETTPTDRAFRKLIKHPQTLQDIEKIGARLTQLADSVYAGKGRVGRMIGSAIAGGIVGVAAFGIFHFVFSKFRA